MPSPRTNHERRYRRIELITLALRARIADSSPDSVTKIGLTLEIVVPCGGVGVLEICHEHARPGIQCVNHHLAIHRAGDLHPAIQQILGNWCNLPISLSDVCG